VAGCGRESVIVSGMPGCVAASRPAAVLVAMALMLVGCDDASDDEPGDQPSATSGPTAESERSIVELDLPAGAARVEERFVAPDPRSHTQTIEVTLDPAGSDVTIEFVTADGATLRVIEFSAAAPSDGCLGDGDGVRCAVRFPVIEARLPGEWAVVAAKPAGDATRVGMEILWEPAEAP
jgi:hypothetical protein